MLLYDEFMGFQPPLRYNSGRGDKVVRIKLSRILGDKRWSQRRLAQETGIRPSTISHYYNDFSDCIRLDHVDRICEALNCDITDLLEYIPNNQKRTGNELILEEHGNRKPK